MNWNNELADADGETGLTLQREISLQGISITQRIELLLLYPMHSVMRLHIPCLKKMQADEKCNASIRRMQGVLPSYTSLGMASLLPHKTIEYSLSYDVLVDGKACSSTEQREAILKEYKISSKVRSSSIQ